MPKKSVCKWTQNKAGSFKTSKLTISDNFSINQSHQSPFRPKRKRKKYLRFWSFLEFENRLFNIFSDFSKITEIFKLEWISSGYDLAPIKPKTTSLYLSRNNWSNSAPAGLPPKCFQPKTSKSPCICLGNEKCPKKVSANDPKTWQEPLDHQHWPFQTTFQSTKVNQDPSRGFRPKKKKISDFAIFRVRKSNFQSRL